MSKLIIVFESPSILSKDDYLLMAFLQDFLFATLKAFPHKQTEGRKGDKKPTCK